MSMTELEKRCVDACNKYIPVLATNNDDLAHIVKAVLAEAGVAELVEALREVQSRITEAMDLERIGAAQALEEMAPIVNAALTGAAS